VGANDEFWRLPRFGRDLAEARRIKKRLGAR
jgi:hypothetical protein